MKFLTKHKSLLTFTLLNYIDKGLSFLLPLLVLYLLKDLNLYNNIEYIFSVANITVVVADMGMRIFFMYNYPKQIHNEKKYISSVRAYFHIISFIYALLGLGLMLLSSVSPVISILIFFICIRTLMTLFINFYSIYYRLTDAPQKILYYSTVINAMSILLVVCLYRFISHANSIWLFFFVQLVFVLIVSFRGIFYIKKGILREMLTYIKQSILYSWPIIINILLMTFISNYGKIYAFSNFSKEVMFSFSYVLRVALIIQMAHSSIISYYSKELYMDRRRQIDIRIYKLYNLFVFIAMGLCILMIGFINEYHLFPKLHFDGTTLILMFYVFFWCQQSYFEQYLSKLNKNRWVLILSVVSIMVYFIFLFAKRRSDLTIGYIALGMLCSTLVNFFGMMFCLYKLNYFSKEKDTEIESAKL